MKSEEEIRAKIKALCDDYKIQLWNVFREYHNQLNDLTNQLLEVRNG